MRGCGCFDLRFPIDFCSVERFDEKRRRRRTISDERSAKSLHECNITHCPPLAVVAHRQHLHKLYEILKGNKMIGWEESAVVNVVLWLQKKHELGPVQHMMSV